MLTLQRASAGSGKTFTLAKKYIWFLLTENEGGTRRLRTHRGIADALPRILAITFTNKATGEMKNRIIDKLAALACAHDGLTNKEAKKIDYLVEFCGELGCTYSKLAAAAQKGLEEMLNEFSNFKVSTIDSFFQNVLRTFAYEANLNDSYQVDVDHKSLASSVVVSTFDTLNNSGEEENALFWLRELMDGSEASGNAWNAFAGIGQESKNGFGIADKVRSTLEKLEHEEFKQLREQLDEYFAVSDGSDPLRSAYEKIKADFDRIADPLVKDAKGFAMRLKCLFEANGLDMKTQGRGNMASQCSKILAIDLRYPYSGDLIKSQLEKLKEPKNVLASKFKWGGDTRSLFDAAVDMYSALERLNDFAESRKMRHWCIYSRLLPYLGLLGLARRKLTEILDGNNAIELSETNSILHDIIGDDDAPFVYERIGSTLDHYLIDEFQDTSRMQWDNLGKLLRENNSRGMENLIIGDAKQSIYRFRSADPSLITTEVPKAFPGLELRGMSRDDNSNWRSDRTVVEFNNFFFSKLTETIGSLSHGKVDFKNLYANVAQYPRKQSKDGEKRRGYVEIDFIGNEDDGVLERVPELISNLIDRGYNQRDIAVLVRRKEEGTAVIKCLVDFNSSVREGGTRIEFISDESLTLSSSDAVNLILNVLRKMTSGTLREVKNSGENDGNGRYADWNDIRTDFMYFALSHQDLKLEEQIEMFLEGDAPDESISAMLADMQTVALPALVEAITERFVPETLRRTQAVFIAAFQDSVLDYCESQPADLGSFLSWWDINGGKVSISSPDDTEAVRVMTYHKSKGLEFKVVIIPYGNMDLCPGKHSEWRWVKPAGDFDDMGLPPFVPVETTAKLEDTDHGEEYAEYLDLFLMDTLNTAYVAFTRAKSELYIFSEGNEANRLGGKLREIIGNAGESLPWHDPETACLMPPAGIFDISDSCMRVGEKPEVEKEESEILSNVGVVDEYRVNSTPEFLHFKEEDNAVVTTDDDKDPRSEGNLLHAVMEGMQTVSDLPRALLRLHSKGMISGKQRDEWETMLSDAVKAELPTEWFSGKWRVINERSLISGKEVLRPDRIMVSVDCSRAVIVDYKFGEERDDGKYEEQVGGYVSAFSEASGIRQTDGYIWYVRKDKIVKVCGNGEFLLTSRAKVER